MAQSHIPCLLSLLCGDVRCQRRHFVLIYDVILIRHRIMDMIFKVDLITGRTSPTLTRPVRFSYILAIRRLLFHFVCAREIIDTINVDIPPSFLVEVKIPFV